MAQYTYSVNYIGPHQWIADEAITADQINNMEAGIVEALNQSDSNGSTINSMSTALTEMINELGRVARIAEHADNSSSQGMQAWQHVQAAIHEYASLDARFSSIDTLLDSTNQMAKNNQTAINNAKGTYGSLAMRLTAMTETDNGLDTRIGNNYDELYNARQGKNSLVENLNAIIETISDNTGNITDINTYITNELEPGIASIQAKIGYTDEETINASPATNVKQIINKIKSDAQAYTDNKITDVNNHFTTLETRITAIDGTEEGTNTIANRLATVEDEIDTANQDGTLNDRFETIEGNISDINDTITGNIGLSALNQRLSALDDEQNGAVPALASRVSTLEDEVAAIDVNAISELGTAVENLQTADQAFSTRLNAIDSNDSNSLKSRIVNLENQATIVVPIPDNGSNFYDGLPTIEEPINTEADYLIQADNTKYYFWRYFEIEGWQLIGGGGSGSGNSNAEDYTSRAAFNRATKELNKDYYVLEEDGIRHHYRYLATTEEAQPIEIGVPANLLGNYQIATSEELDTTTNENDKYLDLYKLALGTNVDTDDIEADLDNYINYRIAHIKLPKGGGGTDVSAARIYARVLGDSTRRISYTDAQSQGITLRFAYTCYSRDDTIYDYTDCTYTLTRGDGKVIATSDGVVSHLSYQEYQDTSNFNITIPNIEKECEVNTPTTFTLTIHNPTDENVRDRNVPVYVTIINLQLSSTFSDNQTYSTGSSLTIPYTFTGMADLDTTFTVLLDNSPITVQNSNNRIVIRANQLSDKSGVHDLTITACQVLSGTQLTSNTLHYQIGLVSGTDDDIMLFSGASLATQKVEQYKILKIPYYLFIPNNGSELVEFKVWELNYNAQHEYTGRIEVPELERPSESMSTGAKEYSFRVQTMDIEVQYYQLVITCSDKTLIFNIEVNIAEEQINIRTDNLVFDFKPERYSNNVVNEEDRLWSYTNGNITYKMRIPDGAHFDWRTGGWMTIDDVPCFCVKAGSRVEFVQEENGTTSPLTLFWPDMETLGGSDFKCTFKIDNVKTPNTPFLTSLDKETNVITNYGKTILSSKQDPEDEDTLINNYVNTQYIFVETINNNDKVVKEAIGTTVLDNSPFYEQLTEEKRLAAAIDARNSNKKKIKKYIGNIYDIVRQASVDEHRDYLLRVLSGKAEGETINYSTIKDEITNYLFDSELYDAGTASNTNAQAVYTRLSTESNDSTTVTYAYRQVEPVNFDALLNGFIVEGKDGKDGIIAMILFTFNASIKSKSKYMFTQTVSNAPISTNSFTETAIFSVTTSEILTTEQIENGEVPEVKVYEVTMSDPEQNGTYTEIVSIRDASNTETRSYGLELNALGSNIYLPSGAVTYAHSEGDTIEFEYNIHPAIANHVNSSIIIYEDGVPSAAKLYNVGNNTFEQANPGCLTIGSDECDVYIYKMRLYDQSISNADILANFYADGLTPDEMIARYERNKTLVAHTSDLTPQIVANECPDLRVIMIEAPNLTGGKTSFIKNTKIRQIYKNGRPEDNWVALNAYHAGQGTSSDNYGVAGRNLDIIFGFDGVDTVIIPKPQKNNYTFDPNYKSILIKGLDADLTNDIKTAAEYEEDGYTVEYNGTGKVSFTEDSVPNNWFNIKVNIASSENTNNAYLQKRFDRYLPYDTPAKKRDDKIKNDMEFFNCVIFIKETGTASEFTEDNSIAAADRPWHFYGIGNIGDSKKTDTTRVNVPGDPKEFCIEISDNGLVLSGFSSGVFYISEASKNRSKAIESPYKLNELNARIAELTAEYDTAGAADKTRIQNELTTLRGYTVMATALAAKTFTVLSSEEYSINNDNYTIQIGVPDAQTMYAVPVVTEAFTYYRCFMFINNAWTEVGEPITFTRTEYGIKYPVSEAEWTSDKNTYYSTLYDINSGKGWDKSYEFRYDLTTKDGETVARNDTEAALNKQRQNFNKTRFANMYSWLVTSSNENYKKTIGDWFIKESPLYWYLFTERYTMIDSRAKNTFYHCGKVYITEDEAAGTNIPALEAAVEAAQTEIELENAQAELAVAEFLRDNAEYFTVDNVLADNDHNNGYRFELWDYDNDTALGINNNGQMVFSAGLEDIDKDVSGWIYNEAESVMWRRIRENMYDDLGALYVRLKGECFNAENLIIEFDNMQNQFPEELWRLDFERKYYRPFEQKNETTYLNDMANGRKKYQRRQFERNMAIYINSKYQRNGSYDPTDIISFRPQFTWTAGRNTEITIKPYSTMYINFMLGNDDQTGSDTVISTRVNRGEPYTINAADYIHDFNNIQCIIYNASRIMELDGLGNFECKQFILGAATKLSVLKLGSVEYTNKSMSDINNMGLSAGLPLLEELDLTNIEFTNAPDTFALENFPLLKKLNATGCNIRSFTFKDGGMLEKIIFPAVLTKIDFKNLYNLVDTYDTNENLVQAVQLTGASNLASYNSINSYAHSYQIIQNMLNNVGAANMTALKLNDIEWTIETLDELEPLATCQEIMGSKMELAGKIIVTGAWSELEKDKYGGKTTSIWPNVEIITDPAYVITKYSIKYYNAYTDTDGVYHESLLWEDFRQETEQYKDPVVAINPKTNAPYLPTFPERPSDLQNNYLFGRFTEADPELGTESQYIQYSGWLYATRNAAGKLIGSTELNRNDRVSTRDIMFIANYPRTTPRMYKITWYDYDGSIIRTPAGANGALADYAERPYGTQILGSIWPTNFVKAKVITGVTGNTYAVFKGWDTPSCRVTGDMNIHSLWETSPAITSISDFSTLTASQLYAISKIEDTVVRNSLLDPHRGNGMFNITMGYTPEYNTAITTCTDLIKNINASASMIYLNDDGSGNIPTYNTSIYPLDDLSKSWTIALDFKVLLDENFWNTSSSITEYVLASCFKQVSGTINGFRVSLTKRDNMANPEIRVYWGTQYIIVDHINLDTENNKYNSYRNIIVLRHDGSSEDTMNNLYVYSRIQNDNPVYYNISSANPDTNIYTNSIGMNYKYWAGSSVDLPISFGLPSESGVSTQLNAPSRGVIYDAKYWDIDLGGRDCELLAAWPHETVSFKITGFDNGYIASNSSSKLIFADTKINFAAAMPMGDRYYLHTGTVDNSAEWWSTDRTLSGWEYTRLRAFCNADILNAFPIVYQSLICTTPILTSDLIDNSPSNPTIRTGNELLDKIYLPTYHETYYNDDGTSGIATAYREVARGWPNWTPQDARIIFIDGSQGLVPETNTSIKPLRWMFIGHAIPLNARIFHIENNPKVGTISPQNSQYADGGTGNFIIRSGDIWWNSSTNVPYMYVTKAEIDRGLWITNTIVNSDGSGWIPAAAWTLRTYYLPTSNPKMMYYVRRGMSSFVFINPQGERVFSQENPTARIADRVILPEFSI